MIRLPCPRHLWHDVDAVDAARIVAALTAALGDELADPIIVVPKRLPEDCMPCSRNVLQWAGDVEAYYEHTASALLSAGVLRESPDGVEVVPWGDREDRRDGKS